MEYRNEVLADNPFAFFEYNETSGNAASTVGSYSAVPTGGVLLNQAGPKGGKSVAFDGVDDLLTVAGLPDFLVGDFTFETWVKYGTQTNDYPTFSRRDGNGKAWLVRTRGPGAGTRVNEMESYHSGQTVQSSPTTYADNLFHHVVMTNASNVGTLYIDNVAITTRNGTVTAGGTGITDTFIGRGAGSIEHLLGNMAHTAFYTGALSTTRIAAHFNAASNAFRGWGLPL